MERYPALKREVFEKIEALAGADLRQVWTPTAAGFFSRVNASYLDALMLDLTGCAETGSGFKELQKQKKAEKAASLERLFTDPDYQAAWQIGADKKPASKRGAPDVSDLKLSGRCSYTAPPLSQDLGKSIEN